MLQVEMIHTGVAAINKTNTNSCLHKAHACVCVFVCTCAFVPVCLCLSMHKSASCAGREDEETMTNLKTPYSAMKSLR